jgi:hypothetical protein
LGLGLAKVSDGHCTSINAANNLRGAMTDDLHSARLCESLVFQPM